MNNAIALILATGTLFLAGCSTTHHAKAWDYRVVYGDHMKPLEPQIQQAAADGWAVVSSGGGDNVTFVILRKPK